MGWLRGEGEALLPIVHQRLGGRGPPLCAASGGWEVIAAQGIDALLQEDERIMKNR